MGKLSILGAQRVKALIEVLEDQKRKELAELEKEKLSYEKAQEIADEEYGISGVRGEIKDIEEKVNKLSSELEQATGYFLNLRTDYHYGSGRRKGYDKRLREIQSGEVDKKAAEVKEKYKDKERSLWLCETLEDAKAIVGIQ